MQMKNKSLIGLFLALSLCLYPTRSNAQVGATSAGSINIGGGAGGGLSSIVNGTCTNQAITNITTGGTATCGNVTDLMLAFTDVTNANATTSNHGLLKKLSGNAYDFFLGNGTYGNTIARGSIAANDPWVFTVTDNNAAVNFTALKLAITDTASNNQNCAIEVFAGASGTTRQFGLCKSGGGTMDGIFTGRVYVGNTVFDNYIGAISGTGRILLGNATAGWNSIFGVLSSTCVSGCGTSPTIEGNSSSTWVTLGTTPSTTTVVLGFGVDLVNSHASCSAYNQTTNTYLAWAATNTQITLTGTFAAGTILTYTCIGHF